LHFVQFTVLMLAPPHHKHILQDVSITLNETFWCNVVGFVPA